MESPTGATTTSTGTKATSWNSPFPTPTLSPQNPDLSHQTRSHQHTPFRPSDDAASTSCSPCRISPLMTTKTTTTTTTTTTTITIIKIRYYTQQAMRSTTIIPLRTQKEKRKEERRLEHQEGKIPVRMSTYLNAGWSRRRIAIILMWVTELKKGFFFCFLYTEDVEDAFGEMGERAREGAGRGCAIWKLLRPKK